MIFMQFGAICSICQMLLYIQVEFYCNANRYTTKLIFKSGTSLSALLMDVLEAESFKVNKMI